MSKKIQRALGRPRFAFGLAVALAAVVGLALVATDATAINGAKGDVPEGTVGPDVTVFSLYSVSSYGSSGGFAGYSVGTRSCNRGDEPLNWCDNNGASGCGLGTTDEDHPVIAQNLYRLKNGRFEQVGLSWLKHGFVSTNSTTSGCAGSGGQSCTGPPLGGNQLGIGCTDPYGSGLNGSRPLGLRSEVNAATGAFPFPYTSVGSSGPWEQRVKVDTDDVDQAQNAGALYWVEGHYVAPDDAASGNAHNNASYRAVNVGGGPSYDLSLVGSTIEGLPAIFAWQAEDAGVEIPEVDVPGTDPVERYHVARRVTETAGLFGWHYEYAVHNLNSDASARSFEIMFPGGTNIGNAGHRTANHHSGEPYDTTSWTQSAGPSNLAGWSTDEFGVNANANALRWGTMFTFWFDADTGPGAETYSIGLFKSGGNVNFSFGGGPAVFGDGFESGDTTAWEVTVTP